MVTLKPWLIGLCLACPMPLLAAPAWPDNLVGEHCTAKPVDEVEPQPGLPADVKLSCADRPAGQLRVVHAPRAEPGNRASLEAAVRSGLRNPRIQSELLGVLRCGPLRWIEPAKGASDEPTLAALSCKHSNGGWPHVVLARLRHGQLWVADGAPSQWPVLRVLLEAPAKEASRAAHLATLKTLFGATVPLATAAERDRFREMIQQARAANQKGLSAQSEQLLREALELQQRLLGPSDAAIADTLMDMALEVSNQGRSEEAARLFAQASTRTDASARPQDRARMNLYRGFDAANRGDFANGLKFAQAAVAVWRSLVQRGAATLDGLTDSDPMSRTVERGELAVALNLVAQMAVRDGQVVLAHAAASEALQILNTTEGLPPAWRADTLLALGDISIAQGRVSAAETYLTQAINIRRRLFGDGPPVMQALAVLGRAYQQEGLHASALITFRELVKLAGQLEPGAEGGLTTDDVIPFVAAARAYADTLKSPAEQQALLGEIFAAFSLVRASMVERTIRTSALHLADDNPALATRLTQWRNAQRRRDAARVELVLEQSAAADQRSAMVEERLTQTIEAASRELADHQRVLERDFPRYQTLSQPAAPTLNQLQGALRANEAVAAYLVGRTQSFVLLIRRDTLHLAPMPEREAALNEQIETLRRAFIAEGEAVTRFDANLAHQLYRSLLGGLGDGLSGVDHLIVASGGPLARLPFGVLIASAPKGPALSGHDWLATRMATTQAPSLAAFYALRTVQVRNRAPRSLLGIGNPQLNGTRTGTVNPCRAGNTVAAGALHSLPALPDSAQELNRISTQLDSRGAPRLLLGRDATETHFRTQPLDQFRVIYVASHAVLPGELSCAAEPGLVLTPPDTPASQAASDGLLTASEIAALRFNADLVVLSACNTASGGPLGGDALSGLAEAFFHAGARGLVASHWQVSSRATQQLMVTLFQNLGPQLDGAPAQALRRAQLSLIAQPETAHPFFWGAFVMVGDGAARTVAGAKLAEGGKQ